MACVRSLKATATCTHEVLLLIAIHACLAAPSSEWMSAHDADDHDHDADADGADTMQNMSQARKQSLSYSKEEAHAKSLLTADAMNGNSSADSGIEREQVQPAACCNVVHASAEGCSSLENRRNWTQACTTHSDASSPVTEDQYCQRAGALADRP
jgi:hypothetical protein